MTRLAIIDRADMNAEQARVYDAAKAAGSPVGGPYVAYIRLPPLFEAAQNMRACLGGGPLSARERLIAYLVTARFWNAQYPWFAQSRAAREAGIEPEIIAAINARATPALGDARERICFLVAAEMLAGKGLSEARYAEAEKILGLEALVALVATIGSFTMTCLTAGTFAVPPPADNPTPLLP
jgi:4-carboxymuconolactone decarboxylase